MVTLQVLAHLVEVPIDKDAIAHIKGVYHKQEHHAVKHGGNGALEDEAEGNNCCCHRCPEMRHIHLQSIVLASNTASDQCSSPQQLSVSPLA